MSTKTKLNPNLAAFLTKRLRVPDGQLPQFEQGSGMNPNVGAFLMSTGALPKHQNMQGQYKLPGSKEGWRLDNPGQSGLATPQAPKPFPFSMRPGDGNWHPKAAMPKNFDPKRPSVVSGFGPPIADDAEIRMHRALNNARAYEQFGGPPDFMKPKQGAAPSAASSYQVPAPWKGVTTASRNAARAQAPESPLLPSAQKPLLPPPQLGNRGAGLDPRMGPQQMASTQAVNRPFDMSLAGQQGNNLHTKLPSFATRNPTQPSFPGNLNRMYPTPPSMVPAYGAMSGGGNTAQGVMPDIRAGQSQQRIEQHNAARGNLGNSNWLDQLGASIYRGGTNVFWEPNKPHGQRDPLYFLKNIPQFNLFGGAKTASGRNY